MQQYALITRPVNESIEAVHDCDARPGSVVRLDVIAAQTVSGPTRRRARDDAELLSAGPIGLTRISRKWLTTLSNRRFSPLGSTLEARRPHAGYDQYSADQVRLFSQELKDFMLRNPA
jgi:hypothetical protein